MNVFLQLQAVQQVQENPNTVVTRTSDGLAQGAQNLGAWLGLTGPMLNIIGGILLLIIGYFIAKFIGKSARNLLIKMGVDKKNSENASIATFGGKLIYYLLMIIVLMATLSMMGVSGEVLAPLNIMVSKFFSAVPDIVAAGIIAYVGYFLAKVVSNLIAASGDKIRAWISEKTTKYTAKKYSTDLGENLQDINRDLKNVAYESSTFDVVKILKNLAFIFTFVPILVIALDKLDMYVITQPLTEMLSSFINAIPNIVYATIVLLVVIIGGKFVSQLLKNLLAGLGVNNLSQKLYLQNIIGRFNFVQSIGNFVYAFIIYMGVIEAASHLNLYQVVDVLESILSVAGKIIFGLIILAVGNAVSNFVSSIFLNGETSNKFLSSIIRAVVMIIFLAMGLKAMGIADSIVELAFGLGLGALAVAFALAFGLGGREAAGEEVRDFFKRLKDKK